MKQQLLIIGACLSMATFSTLTQAHPEDNRGGFDRTAMNKVCVGKKLGQAVSTKMGDRTMKGTCELGFTANNPANMSRGERGSADACKGKTIGQAISVKVNGKTVSGKCEVRFKMQRS